MKKPFGANTSRKPSPSTSMNCDEYDHCALRAGANGAVAVTSSLGRAVCARARR
ncbi:MAG: hypothetical protein KIT31_33575 [Deltaproteobacteria bacterium]|nr:hypothetical protein [Deltaproteobacteria bacterium]